MPKLTKDDIGKELFGRNDIFASVFNLLLYGGRQVIKPEELSDIPTEQLFFKGDEAERRVRDIFKMVTFKEDENGRYLFLGIENQSKIDPFMILRIMLYDAICYIRQVEDPDIKTIVPSFTVVFNCSGRPWRNKRSFYDCVNVPRGLEDVFRTHNGDHIMMMLDPYSDADNDLELLHSELSLVTLAMKWSTNKDKYISFMSQDSMRNVSKLVFNAIRILNEDRYLKMVVNEEGNIDMCLATEMIAEEKRQQWKAEGEINGIALAVSALMRKFGLTSEAAMDDLDIPLSERPKILALLNS